MMIMNGFSDDEEGWDEIDAYVEAELKRKEQARKGENPTIEPDSSKPSEPPRQKKGRRPKKDIQANLMAADSLAVKDSRVGFKVNARTYVLLRTYCILNKVSVQELMNKITEEFLEKNFTDGMKVLGDSALEKK